MILIDDDQRTLHLTRGDKTDGTLNKVAFYLPYYDDTTKTEKNYMFEVGDKISFVVMKKKGYTKQEILRKEFTLTEATECPEITLSATDTKKFELANKTITYWYEITLNDNMTILGYDEEGASKLIVYPESGESN